MTVGAFVLDAWAALSYKRDNARRLHSSERSLVAPTWAGEEERSRLEAYLLLASYFANVARFFAPEELSDDDRRSHREYGDAALLVKAVRSAVLGDDQQIVVEGAEDDPGEEPQEPAEGADDAARAEFRTEHAEWARRLADQEAAAERQEWLRTWASPQVERFTSKMLETELDAQKLGDGLYVLAWSDKKRRNRLRIFDPAAYFPVLDGGSAEDEFPRRIHVAWQYTEHRPDGDHTFVRRLTWELGGILPALDDDGLPLFDEDGTGMVLREGTFVDADGRIARQLPYSDEPTTETCFHSDGTWEVTDGASVDDFSESSASWAFDPATGERLRRADLGIDYIPVVHLPNTVAIKGHFGEALVTALAQLLDDLAAADTDAAKAADLVGVPMIGASGVQVAETVAVRPGAFLQLGADGKLSVVDLSAGLVALHRHVETLLDRLTTNARMPDAVLGRVEPSAVASGLHMLLLFGPMQAMVAEQRLVRDEKYPLLLKMIQRRAMVAGAASLADGRELAPGELDPASDVLDARVAFGSFLPNDRKALIDEWTALWTAGLCSRKRALLGLAAGGVELGDVAEELEAIEAEDFARALSLLEATGDEQAVFDYLHREAPEPADEPVEPEVPPGPVPPGAVPPVPPIPVT